MSVRRSPAALAVAALALAGLSACSDPAPSTVPTTAANGSGSPTAGCSAAAVLASWPTDRLAAQVLVSPVRASDLPSVRRDVAAGIGGIILFGSEVPADLASRLDDLRSAAPDGIAPFVSSDEEGGAVQRLRSLVGPVPAARTLGATRTPAEILSLATQVGARMAAGGVDVDLAPVADLDGRPGPSSSNPDGTRSFGTDPVAVSDDVVAFAQGLGSAGVVAVVKHFPGLGGASANTDVAPATTRPWSVLQQSDLQPFAAAIAAGVPGVMVANASVPGLTDLPASLSPEVVSVLRDRLAFDGVVMTDSLSAKAIAAAGYSVPDAAVAALAAGVDSVLYGSGGAVPKLTAKVIDRIVDAVGSGALPRERLVEAAGRVLALKGVDVCSSRS